MGFQIGIRKTFAVSIETAWDFLFSEKGLAFLLGNIELESFCLDKPYKIKDALEGKIGTFNPFLNIRMTWRPVPWTNIRTSCGLQAPPMKSQLHYITCIVAISLCTYKRFR